MKEEKQNELFPGMLDAQAAWFHVFKSMIENGDFAKMGPYAISVYMVVKCYTNWKTGRAWPGIETIVEKSGISKRQVINALKTLEDFGYVIKTKHGRSNIYTLREKVEVYEKNSEEDGRPAAIASWDYIPRTVKDASVELRNFVLTGKKDGLNIIHIEFLNINLQQNWNNETVVQYNEAQAKAEAERTASILARPKTDRLRKSYVEHIKKTKGIDLDQDEDGAEQARE